MEEVLKELMNRGFLIYESDAKFVLAKFPTPADPRTAITEEVLPDTSRLEFNTFVMAMEEAKLLIDWKDKRTTSTELVNCVWVMQMMYHHPTGPKFVELGEMSSVTYDVAVSEARSRAERYLEELPEAEGISGFDVKVRPTQKS